MGVVIDVEDLTDFMSGIDLTAEQRAAAEDIIEGVEGQLALYLNRPLVPTTTTQTVKVGPDGYLQLKNTPVTAVTSVTWPYGNITGYVISDGAVEMPSLYYGASVTITYTGGLDVGSMAAVRIAVLRVAAREMENRHDDTLSLQNGVARDTAPAQPIGWQMEELRRLSRYRRRVAVS